MDKQELQRLRDLPIEGVAERLGISVTRQHKGLCPFHDDRHPSMSFNRRKNSYRCFVCGASGSGPIDLVMNCLGKDFREACRWLADENSIILSADRRTHGGKGETGDRGDGGDGGDAERPPRAFDAARYERYFERPWLSAEARHFLFDERRLSPAIISWCRLTSWRDRQGVPWLQIPYYDRDGRLIGMQNRNLVRGASPRFRFPYGATCSVYNMPVLRWLEPGEPLFITEGASDCWAMLSSGHKAIAIPSATLLRPADHQMLRDLERQGVAMHMYPDQDEPGERLFMRLREIVPTLCRHQLPKGCKDFSEYYLNRNNCTKV